MLKAELTVKNEAALTRTIDQIKYLQGTKALTKTKKEFRNYLIEKITDNFNNSSEADGTPWKKLKYRKGDPLVLTRKLMKSIRGKNTATGVLIWSSQARNVHYGIYHNEGTKKIPVRRFMPKENEIPEEWYTDLKNMIVKNFKEGK